jgi:general L-amino acid transport system substrate-binding protein
MIRRLAVLVMSMLALAGCDRPQAPAAAPKPVSDAGVEPQTYKPSESPTLKAVRARGHLICGVHPGLPGFAFPDARGRWRGFDVDICRAVAAATLGDAEKVEFVAVGAQARLGVVTSGRVDILSRNTSRTFARDAGLGLSFPVVTYYDGQGFLVPRALGLGSAEELSGARICVQKGTVSQDNLADWFQVRGLRYRPVLVGSETEARRLYETEACDAFTADVSALAGSRSLMSNPKAHVILAEVISKEPLGPVVRQGDPVWADIVAWTVYAAVLGEELRLSSETVTEARKTATDPEIRRLLGVDANLGALLGLSPDWAFQVIRQVGAYDEIFRRDVGAESPLELERGLNALWNAKQPGLIYAPPMR